MEANTISPPSKPRKANRKRAREPAATPLVNGGVYVVERTGPGPLFPRGSLPTAIQWRGYWIFATEACGEVLGQVDDVPFEAVRRLAGISVEPVYWAGRATVPGEGAVRVKRAKKPVVRPEIAPCHFIQRKLFIRRMRAMKAAVATSN